MSRFGAAGLGFAFVAVWTGLGFAKAVLSLFACVACYLGAPIVQEGSRRACGRVSALRMRAGHDSAWDRGSRRVEECRRRASRERGAPQRAREPRRRASEQAGDPDLRGLAEAPRRTGYGW